jgi:hypothetical protein
MSDPVTHSEIEDVLSSIRRLVRETGREETPSAQPKPASRLVLTPALRVHEPEASRAPQASQEGRSDTGSNGAQDSAATRAAASDAVSVLREKSASAEKSRVLHRAPAHDTAPAQDTAPEGSQHDRAAAPNEARQSHVATPEPTPVAAPEEPIAEAPFVEVDEAGLKDVLDEAPNAPIPLDAVRRAEPQYAAPQETLDEAQPEHMGEVAPQVSPASPADTAADAPIETPVEAPADAPWRDPGARLFDSLETGTPSKPTVAENADAAPAPAQQDAAETTATPTVAGDEAVTSPGQSSRVAAVVRRIAELETAGRVEAAGADEGRSRAPEINEDDIEAVPHSGPTVETIQWEDHQDTAPQTAPFTESAQDMTQDALTEATMNRLAASEEFMDEEGLRELVTSIVREELQGALGERITRNVRKLVRREIQRALSTQELL